MKNVKKLWKVDFDKAWPYHWFGIVYSCCWATETTESVAFSQIQLGFSLVCYDLSTIKDLLDDLHSPVTTTNFDYLIYSGKPIVYIQILIGRF